MATTAIRNTAVIPANDNRGESKFRSIYNSIAHVLKPHLGPGELEMLAARNRSSLTERDEALYKAYMKGSMPFC